MRKAKRTKEYVKCLDCKNAYLMRRGNNPIVAQCNIHNAREVANMQRVCQSHVEESFKRVHEMQIAKL